MVLQKCFRVRKWAGILYGVPRGMYGVPRGGHHQRWGLPLEILVSLMVVRTELKIRIF